MDEAAARRAVMHQGQAYAILCPVIRMPRILVVEDDPDISELIAHYLTRAGHDVDRLAHGGEAPRRVRESPPDLVVLDLMLPGLDGLMVCQALRADPATAAIPIIMLTARGEETD